MKINDIKEGNIFIRNNITGIVVYKFIRITLSYAYYSYILVDNNKIRIYEKYLGPIYKSGEGAALRTDKDMDDDFIPLNKAKKEYRTLLRSIFNKKGITK